MISSIDMREEILMASEESKTTEENEKYLYLYTYRIEEKHYIYFDYFKDREEAETFLLFCQAAHQHIKTVSLEECPYGMNWRGLQMPHKKSEWKDMHHKQG